MPEVVDDSLTYDRDATLAGGDGRFSVTFKGTLNGEPVVVNRTFLNRIEVITKNEDLLKIRHPNIAHLLHIATDDDFRYDALEPFEAPLDSIFCKNDDPKKYNGPSLPSHEQVLLQLANGLSHLHLLNILHGDIKPENILISSTGESVQMKWTRFGFRPSSLNDSCSLTPIATEMGPRKWWPPEMYKDKKKLSMKGEIFSAGCVFLYFLSGGVYPFAQDTTLFEFGLEKNVSRGTLSVKLKGPNNSDLSTSDFAFVKKMTYQNPDKRMSLWDVIRRLEALLLPNFSDQIKNKFPSLPYVEKTCSNGQYSCGLYLSESERLAVKRIPNKYCSVKAFVTKLIKLNHSNIVRLLEFHEDSSYKYFGMEYCSASLDHLFLPEGHHKKYTGPMPSHEKVFLQLISGLQYLHEKDLVHGSIKPSNILINAIEDPHLKLADFGLGLIAPRWDNINSRSDALVSEFQSEHYWLAPELLKRDVEPNETAILSRAIFQWLEYTC